MRLSTRVRTRNFGRHIPSRVILVPFWIESHTIRDMTKVHTGNAYSNVRHHHTGTCWESWIFSPSSQCLQACARSEFSATRGNVIFDQCPEFRAGQIVLLRTVPLTQRHCLVFYLAIARSPPYKAPSSTALHESWRSCGWNSNPQRPGCLLTASDALNFLRKHDGSR